MEASLPQNSGRTPAGASNWNIIIQRFESHLQYLFGEELQDDDWKTLPILGPKQHFYPPNVKFVEAQPSTPLNMETILDNLEKECIAFTSLLDKRKSTFDSKKEWDETDSELSTSSSDSDQEFEVEEIIDKKVDDDGNVRYLVTWKDFPGESTWVRKSNMESSADLIEEYENK